MANSTLFLKDHADEHISKKLRVRHRELGQKRSFSKIGKRRQWIKKISYSKIGKRRTLMN